MEARARDCLLPWLHRKTLISLSLKRSANYATGVQGEAGCVMIHNGFDFSLSPYGSRTSQPQSCGSPVTHPTALQLPAEVACGRRGSLTVLEYATLAGDTL